MSTDSSTVFKKDNVDLYLKELAKEYKKLVGKKMPAEIVLIGGAAILESYGFRDMTTDIDAIINAASSMKDAINRVGDRFGLPNGWINADFQKTGSYSNKLLQYSSFYRTFNQALNVRIVTGEYLVAMKLRAFRQYKNDLSDVIGILAEHEGRGDSLTLERIEKAISELYGSWSEFPDGARDFIINALNSGDYERVYAIVRRNEKDTKEQLIDFEDKYPEALNEKNVNDVLAMLRARKNRSDNEHA